MNSLDTEIQPYYGTYLIEDKDCSGSDIQYLIIDRDGMSVFDYLGDSCDDTVNCYLSQSFELIESSVEYYINYF